MSLQVLVLGSNPFFDAFFHTDLLGKIIFVALLACSVISWTLIIHKIRLKQKIQRSAAHFAHAFQRDKLQPLNVAYSHHSQKEFPHPFWVLYQTVRQHAIELLNKNKCFGQKDTLSNSENASFLSTTDVEVIASHANSAISSQNSILEKNLFILSTIVTLSPFLGLLGTVWGILTTFTELQAHTSGNTNQLVLGGLSLALATTVLGLIDAIPALIGYNYLKNGFREFQTEMETFSNEVLAAVELHYRKVDSV